MGMTLRARRLLEGSDESRKELMENLKIPFDEELRYPAAMSLHLIEGEKRSEIVRFLLRKISSDLIEPLLNFAKEHKDSEILKRMLSPLKGPDALPLIQFIIDEGMVEDFGKDLVRPLMTPECQEFVIKNWNSQDPLLSDILLNVSGYYRNQKEDFNVDLYEKFLSILYADTIMENVEASIDKLSSVERDFKERLHKRNLPVSYVEKHGFTKPLLCLSVALQAKQISNRARVITWIQDFCKKIEPIAPIKTEEKLKATDLTPFKVLSESFYAFIQDDNSVGERQLCCEALEIFESLYRNPEDTLKKYKEMNEQVQTDGVKIYLEKSIERLEKLVPVDIETEGSQLNGKI